MIRRSFTAAFAALALLLTLIATPAQARREWQAFGGGGDATTKIECPAGQVMVGVQGRAGAYITQLRIICASLTGDFSTSGARGYGGYVGGRPGGSAGETRCSGDTVMTELAFRLTPDKRRVARIYVQCISESGETRGGGTFSGDGDTEGCGGGLGGCAPEEGTRVQTCPREQFVGLTVRSGADVNAIGAICDRRDAADAAPPRAAAAAPPPPPPAYRTTGRRGAPTAPAASFLGAPFSVTSTPGMSFTLVLHEDEGPGAMWGELKFANSKYNGTLIGKLRADRTMFDFTYEQPDAGISGSGTLMIFSNGKVVSGKATTNADGQTMTWVGRR